MICDIENVIKSHEMYIIVKMHLNIKSEYSLFQTVNIQCKYFHIIFG